MLSPILLLILFVVVLGGWFFMDSLRVREIAIGLSRQACNRSGLQFLDDTVSMAHIRFRGDGRGHLRINRTYQFEFSDGGNDRRAGYVVMRGGELQILHLDLPEERQGINGRLH